MAPSQSPLSGNSQSSSSGPARPPQKPRSMIANNPFETVKEELRAAGKQMADIPKEIAQEAVDQMWATIYGVDNVPKRRKEGEKEPDSYTQLSMEKLNAAYAKNDAAEAEAIKADLAHHQESVQLNAARHREVQQDTERAIEEIRVEREQMKKEETEKEQMEHQKEQEEAAAAQQNNTDGNAKTKVGIGQKRPKASTDTAFESGKKKG